MIEIEKKDFEAVVEEIITTKDLRSIIGRSLVNDHHFRAIIKLRIFPRAQNQEILR